MRLVTNTQPCVPLISKTSARFNLPGESKGKFCSKHKEPGMVDIVHPHCKIEGCTTLASFNISGQSRGEYCSQHKLVSVRVDALFVSADLPASTC